MLWETERTDGNKPHIGVYYIKNPIKECGGYDVSFIRAPSSSSISFQEVPMMENSETPDLTDI